MFSPSCDTMVAMSDVTESGSIIFGKNTDRQPNEPLSIRYVSSAVHLPNSKLQTTYIEIDQVEKTNACILFSPTNIFGAEMGFNSHGLVIGNEALFTKIPSYSPGLTGMDIVRLVLERCCTSKDGKNTIIELLQKYGQGGNCGFASSFYYHNSFLVVDSHEAWLIETVGKEYAAKRITSGIHTISNIISFGGIDTFDEYSNNLITQAISNGWCRSILDFHFQKCYSGISLNPKQLFNGFITTHFACSARRQCRSRELINQASIKSKATSVLFRVTDMFNVLRDHEHSRHSPAHGLTNVDICMHAGFGPIRFCQTTGALVSVIPTSNNQIPTHYATCTALTCLSVFKPIWLDPSLLPPSFISSPLLSTDATISNPSCTYSSNNLWWKSEIMTRNVMKYYSKLIEKIQLERDSLEREITYTAQRLALTNVTQKERNHFTIDCFDKVDQLTNTWFNRAYSLSFESDSEHSVWHEHTWNSWSRSGKIPSELLRYSKVEIDKGMITSVSFLLISLMLVLFSAWTYTPIGCTIQLINFAILTSSILYLFLMESCGTRRKIKGEQLHIRLTRLNFTKIGNK